MLDERKAATRIWKVADSLGLSGLLDRRGRARLRAHFHVVLSGMCGYIEARGLNVTREGAALDSPDPAEVGSLVYVQLPHLGLEGFAHVRRCDPRSDGRFTLGLRFRGALLSVPKPEFGGGWLYQRVRYGASGAWDGSGEA